MSQSIVPIANRYLHCKQMRKSAAWKWVETPYGWEIQEDKTLKKDTLQDDQAGWGGFSTLKKMDIQRALEDPRARDIIKQYFFSKIHADKHPEYKPVVDKIEKAVPYISTAYEGIAPMLNTQIQKAQSWGPGLSRHNTYKALDETMLSLLNDDGNTDNDMTLEEFDPRLSRTDFSQYSPGMAVAGLAPVAIGAMTGNFGSGALLGALLAGGLGYYGYNRVNGKWGPTFIDDMLGTQTAGMTDSQYEKWQAEHPQTNTPPETEVPDEPSTTEKEQAPDNMPNESEPTAGNLNPNH